MPRVSAERLETTRRQILDGARRAFARHGYEGATVRLIEAETGLSRGAIFHHFPDKDALFLALARQDAEEMAAIVDRDGLVEVMRGLRHRDAGWLGVQLEVTRRLRTDPAFRARWTEQLEGVARCTRARLRRQQRAGTVRDDLPVPVLAAFLTLVHDGLLLHLATGMPTRHLDRVLDLTETAVRTPAVRTPTVRKPAVRKPAVRKPAVRPPAVRKITVPQKAATDTATVRDGSGRNAAAGTAPSPRRNPA